MPTAESLGPGEIDLVPAEERRAPRPLVGPWASTAAAATLHAAVLFMGSLVAAAPREEAEGEAIDRLRRYLAASESRDPPRDTRSPESQTRVVNRLAEGRDGAGPGGDDAPGEGTENKASSGHLSAAGAGEGKGKKGKGTGALAPSRVAYGRLPAEVIQRIVRQNFGRFRLCLEQSPNFWWGISNRITVRFVIDRNGDVSSAFVTQTDIWDRKVTGCVARGFHTLHFPPPEGGVVVVSYPIMFSPGG
jgi:hypothetical protein